jgi:hypothetical protein
MINSHQWAQSRSLVRVVLLALALTALISIVLLFASPRSASAQSSPTADYRFQNTKTSSVGTTVPALTDIGPGTNTFTTATVDGASRRVLSFPQGNGLKLSPTTGVIPNGGTYTIVVLFELDSVSGYRRIIDFKNGTNDRGLYVHEGKLEFFPHASGTSTPITANTYVQVVLTRDASSGTVVGYVDGAQQFSFTDTAGDAVIDSSFNTLRFFRDNEAIGGVSTEHSAGSVARIRLYNTALVDPDVLDRIEPTIFTVNSPPDAPDHDIRDGKCDVSTTVGIQCTLRAAIQQAGLTEGEDTINFASGVRGTIPLNSSLQELLIVNDSSAAKDLTINGPGARVLTVSGNNASRVFWIRTFANATINGLSISGGNTRAFGGGIYNNGGTLTLNNSTVSGNTAFAGHGGGIANDNGGTLTLTRTTVSGNQAIAEVIGGTRNGGAGGGISNISGSLTLTNSTVSGNTATDNAGGIDNHSGTLLTLTNTTVTNNSPGGIVNSGSATLTNTIVAGNSPSNFPDVQGSFASQGPNLIGQAPLLGPLQNNGGATNTHALLPGSPAIDTGTNANCLSPDQRGVARPKDGDQNGSSICDIGAYERSDLTAPKVNSTIPAAGATGVSRNANLTATFSEKMTRSTLNTTTFKLFKVNSDGSTTQISSWTVSSSTDGLKATLNPFGTSSTLLLANTRYKAVVTTGARDLAGNQLDQDSTVAGNQQKEWTFTTGST